MKSFYNGITCLYLSLADLLCNTISQKTTLWSKIETKESLCHIPNVNYGVV